MTDLICKGQDGLKGKVVRGEVPGRQTASDFYCSPVHSLQHTHWYKAAGIEEQIIHSQRLVSVCSYLWFTALEQENTKSHNSLQRK